MTPPKDWPGRIGLAATLVCALLTARAPVRATDPEAIPWRTDLHGAEIEARAQDRLLWIQFTGSWCPNCVRLQRESFVQPNVVGYARHAFVPVRIQTDEREDLVDRFGLSGIPATVLLKPSGEVVARREGYIDARGFQSFLERALIQTGRTAALAPRRSDLTQTSAPPPRAPGALVPAAPTRPRRGGAETVRR
jgi:hypothetical protein